MTHRPVLTIAMFAGLAAAGATAGAWAVLWSTTQGVGDALEFVATVYGGNH